MMRRVRAMVKSLKGFVFEIVGGRSGILRVGMLWKGWAGVDEQKVTGRKRLVVDVRTGIGVCLLPWCFLL